MPSPIPIPQSQASPLRLLGICLAPILSALLLFASPSAADQVICEAGAGPGQCASPTAIDVDRAEGLVYVADNGNREVDVYDADDGAFVESFAIGFPVSSLAVDNDEASPAFGHVYVFDNEGGQVVRLNPAGEAQAEFGEGLFASQPALDIGPGGTVYVADDPGGGDRRVQTFDHEGNSIEVCFPLEPGGFGGNLQGFAVDSAGGFYLASAGNRSIERYDSSCNWLEEPFHTSFNIRALALDGDDELFVADATESRTAIYHYSPTNTLLRAFYGNGTLNGFPNSLAPLSTPGGDIFASEGEGLRRVVQVAFPPPGPAIDPDPAGTEAERGNTSATLRARINPQGEATEYRFQYLTQTDYEAQGNSFEGPATRTTPTAEVEVPEPEDPRPDIPQDFTLIEVEAPIGCPQATQQLVDEGKCLVPETVYRFRVVATNPSGEDEGPTAAFETKAPFEILDAFASRVGAGSARLHAVADPLRIELTGRFQYLTEADYQAQGESFEGPATQTTEKVSFGGGDGPVTRAVQLHGLQADTTYRFRVVVENFFVSGASEAAAFATFAPPALPGPCPNDALRAGAGAALPDCRAYEMVSPLDKAGGEVVARPGPVRSKLAKLNKVAAAVPAAGPGATYSSARAFGDAVSAPFTSQYLASRGPGGWSSHGISPPREGPSFFSLSGLDTQFKAFSEDLRYGWLRADSDPPLDGGAVAGFANLYRRDNASDAFRSLCMSQPGSAAPSEYTPEPQGFSADGSVTVFRADDELAAASGGPGIAQLYACELGGGQAALVSVLPPSLGGGPSEDNSSAGTAMNTRGDHRELSLHNAVANDASRVYWTDSGPFRRGQGRLYLRENPLAAGAECTGESAPCTVAVSEAVGGEGSGVGAHFWTASTDGTRAIFSFTEDALEGELYAFDAETGVPEPIAGGLGGLAGWSEDARVLYPVSTEELAEGAEGAEENLYRYDADAPAGEEFELVAVLEGGTSTGAGCAVDLPNPTLRCARSTTDGGALAFMSTEPLTGYVSKDAHSGAPAAQVFLYDADGEGGEGELLCVSCNPSGGRPQSAGGAAARIPSWESSMQASRLLSADGERLFFESHDALVPADVNGALDVYQWERAGKGSCDASDPDHFASNGGCLSLISSGSDSEPSEFVDASADGSDVFFTTSESLYGPDPGLIDLYDARIGGGFAAPEPPRPPCEAGSCSDSPPPPDPPVPSSQSFVGPPGVPPAATLSPCAKAARQARSLSGRAKRLRRAARRSEATREARRSARRARALAKRAGRRSRAAKRCRRVRARKATAGRTVR